MIMVWTYAIYIVLSIALTALVAQTLHKNGRIFLVDAFKGNEKLADSVNHLLVVGFYLINIGYVSLALKYGEAATDAGAEAEEARVRMNDRTSSRLSTDVVPMRHRTPSMCVGARP